MTAPPALTVVGAGSLARSLLSGWAHEPATFSRVVTVSRRRERAQELAPMVSRALSVEEDADAAARAVTGADIVIVAVKPWMMADVLPQMAPVIQASGATVVSVAAGVRLATLRGALPSAAGIVRVLPNTPTQARRGITGLSADASTTRVEQISGLFSMLGEVVRVDEDRLDALTVLSGSTPAFFFSFVEQLTTVIGTYGFAPETAERLARQVFLGSAALLEHSGDDAAELRRRVTSPNGVTHHALEVLERGDFGGLVGRAVAAGLTRTAELAAGTKGSSS
ncbi:MAG: proC [Microbacterium sp.]|jgi:pyrroline-5-carboxylate reductase|nr:proC [Microbacterium sp.]